LSPEYRVNDEQRFEYEVAGELSVAFNRNDLAEVCEILLREVRRVGVRAVCEQTGMHRSAIYAALQDHRNPTAAVLLAVMRAVGQLVVVYPIRGIILPNGPEHVLALRETAKRKDEE
jgi:DNA-binding phage protein